MPPVRLHELPLSLKAPNPNRLGAFVVNGPKYLFAICAHNRYSKYKQATNPKEPKMRNTNPDITVGMTYNTANAVYKALEAQAAALEHACHSLAGPAHNEARRALRQQIDALLTARLDMEEATEAAHQAQR